MTTLAEAVAATRHCDRLCTLIAVQSHCVKAAFLKVALVSHTFTCLLPPPKPETADDGGVRVAVAALYAEQLDLLLLLGRIMEHFAASAFEVDHTRVIDGVRWWSLRIAAVADAVMRQPARDIPSEVCAHLRGEGKRKGFTIGSGALAKQSAAVPCHTAELNTARTAALDYFAAQAGKPRVFQWEKSERLEKETQRWLKLACKDLAFPADHHSLANYISDTRGLLIKNFPEFHAYAAQFRRTRRNSAQSLAQSSDGLSSPLQVPRHRLLREVLPQPAALALPAKVAAHAARRRAHVRGTRTTSASRSPRTATRRSSAGRSSSAARCAPPPLHRSRQPVGVHAAPVHRVGG